MGKTLEAQLELSDLTLARLFGQGVAVSQNDIVVEAATATIRKRYAGQPWEGDRVSDGALAAMEAVLNYREGPGSGLYTLANYVVGMASGLSRNAATAESEVSQFVASFSDLIPSGIEDEDEFIENLLGESAVYSPVSAHTRDEDWQFDPGSVAFYTESGVIGLRQVADRIAHSAVDQALLAEMLLTDDFTAVEELADAVYERLAAWAAGTDIMIDFDAEAEVEPETCPLSWVWVKSPTTEWVPELRRGMGTNMVAPVLEEDEAGEDPDLVYEEWATRADELKGLFDEGYSGAWCEKVSPDKVWTTHLKVVNGVLVEYRDFVGDLVTVITDARQSLPYNERKGVTIHELLTEEELFELVDPALEYAQSLGVEDVNLNDVMLEFAAQVSGQAKVKGTFKAIRDLATESLELRNLDVEPVKLDDTELRKQLSDAVDAGEMFASRAVVVLAKLDGKHNQLAAQLGDEVYQKSKQLKAVFGQKRFAYTTEKLIAEQVYPAFRMGLPKHLIGVVGPVDAGFVKAAIAKLPGSIGIVGCDEHAADVAAALGLRYVEIPRHDDSWLALQWANGQVMAVATHVVASVPTNAQAALKHWMDQCEKPYRIQ